MVHGIQVLQLELKEMPTSEFSCLTRNSKRLLFVPCSFNVFPIPYHCGIYENLENTHGNYSLIIRGLSLITYTKLWWNLTFFIARLNKLTKKGTILALFTSIAYQSASIHFFFSLIVNSTS